MAAVFFFDKKMLLHSLKLTYVAPESLGLGSCFFGIRHRVSASIFRCELTVSFGEGIIHTLPETNSSPLKMDGWNTTDLLKMPYFQVRKAVSFGEFINLELRHGIWGEIP